MASVATSKFKQRVLLVDDQRLIRLTVGAICRALGLLDVVGEAENGQEAVEMADRLLPDLVLMDAEMPIMDGLQAARKITELHPQTAVIILSAHSQRDLVREAIRFGARGYIQKDELTETRLENAVKVIEAGGLFFDINSGTGLLQSIYPV